MFLQLLWPLARLLLTMCVGLLVASLLEALHWTRLVARLATPLAKAGHLQDIAAASFALAFFSPSASNSLLAEAHNRGELSRAELVLANLFNSSPSYLVHLPTVFFLVFAFLGSLAFVYIGLSFAASVLRTAVTLLAGRLVLAQPKQRVAEPEAEPSRDWRAIAIKTLRRLKKRVVKMLLFTVPIYTLFFVLQRAGLFGVVESWLAEHAIWFDFLNPKSLSVVVLHLLAEQSAALSAAASLLHTGGLTGREIIMALLVGSIVAAPMRALRHQFPSYAGYFAPALALQLVVANQLCRALSLVCVTLAYYWYAF